MTGVRLLQRGRGWGGMIRNRGFCGEIGVLLKTGEFYEASESIKSGDV